MGCCDSEIKVNDPIREELNLVSDVLKRSMQKDNKIHAQLSTLIKLLEERIKLLEKRMDSVEGGSVARAWTMTHDEVMDEIRIENREDNSKQKDARISTDTD